MYRVKTPSVVSLSDCKENFSPSRAGGSLTGPKVPAWAEASLM